MIIKENISNFKRGRSSKSILEIGESILIKKWIDNFEKFKSKGFYGDIGKCIINEDLSITIFGKLDFRGNWYGNLPEYIQIHEIFKPRSMGNKYSCYVSSVNNGLSSLRGFPEYIQGTLAINNNIELNSLIGCPKSIDDDFYFYSCSISNLDGAPNHVAGDVYPGDNPGNFTEDDIRKAIPNIGGEIYFSINK